MDPLRKQQLEHAGNPEVGRVCGEQPSHARRELGDGQARNQNAPVAEPMAGHPMQNDYHGVVGGEDMNPLLRIPPPSSFRRCFCLGTRLAIPTRLSDDPEQRRQDARSTRPRHQPLEALLSQQHGCPDLSGSVGSNRLDRQRRVRCPRSFLSLPSNISPSRSASGCGRSCSPSERPFKSESEGPCLTEQRRAAGWPPSVRITSPEVGRFDTNASRRSLASIQVPWPTDRSRHRRLGAKWCVLPLVA